MPTARILANCCLKVYQLTKDAKIFLIATSSPEVIDTGGIGLVEGLRNQFFRGYG